MFPLNPQVQRLLAVLQQNNQQGSANQQPNTFMEDWKRGYWPPEQSEEGPGFTDMELMQNRWGDLESMMPMGLNPQDADAIWNHENENILSTPEELMQNPQYAQSMQRLEMLQNPKVQALIKALLGTGGSRMQFDNYMWPAYPAFNDPYANSGTGLNPFAQTGIAPESAPEQNRFKSLVR